METRVSEISDKSVLMPSKIDENVTCCKMAEQLDEHIVVSRNLSADSNERPEE